MKFRLFISILFAAILLISCGKEQKKNVIAPPFDNVNKPLTTMNIDAEKDTLLRLETGTTIHIEANSFTDANGNPVSGNVNLKYREMHNAAEILCSGIPMIISENGVEEQFESAGMFEIDAQQNGEQLKIANDKSIEVDFASYTKEDGYEHFILKQPKNTTAFNFELPLVKKAYAEGETTEVKWQSVGKSEVKENEHKKKSRAYYNKLFFKLLFDTKKYPQNNYFADVWWEMADVNDPTNPNFEENNWVLKEEWHTARLFDAMIYKSNILTDEIVIFPKYGFTDIEFIAVDTFTIYFTTMNEHLIEQFYPGARSEFMFKAVCTIEGEVLSILKAGTTYNYITHEEISFGQIERLKREIKQRMKNHQKLVRQLVNENSGLFLPNINMSLRTLHNKRTDVERRGDKYVEVPDGVVEIAISPDKKYMILGSQILKTGLHIYQFKERQDAYYLEMANGRKKYRTRVVFQGDLAQVNEMKNRMKEIETEFIAHRMAEEEQRLEREADYLRSFDVDELGIYNVDRIYKVDDNIPLAATFDFGDINLDYNNIKVYQITGNKQTVIVKYTQTEDVLFAYSPSQPNQLIAVLPENKIARFSQTNFDKLDSDGFKAGDKITFKMKIEDEVNSVEMLASKL